MDEKMFNQKKKFIDPFFKGLIEKKTNCQQNLSNLKIILKNGINGY